MTQATWSKTQSVSVRIPSRINQNETKADSSTVNPANGSDNLFVRDPRINWVDTMSTSTSGYLYFTVNQLVFSPLTWPGTDRRKRPFALFRVPLLNNATKPILV